jgi:endo-1,4-beta-xylanase
MLTRRQFLDRTLRAAAAAPALTLLPQLMGCAHQDHITAPSLPSADRQIAGPGSLRARAAAHGLYVGSAIDVAVLQREAVYRDLAAQQFNMVVAEREMKWNILRPSPDRYDFSLGDALIAFARQHRMKVRGHNLAWHEALPDWFAKTVTPSNAARFLTEHVTTVVCHFRGHIHSWDVVNEAILPKDGRLDGLRKSPWLDLLGPSYIDIAFRAARASDPHTILTYNDYGVEYDNDEDAERRKHILTLLEEMRSRGVPLDAVGIQSHIKAASKDRIGSGLRDFLSALHAMKLRLYITELDVNEDDIQDNDPTVRDRIIAETYAQYLEVVMQQPGVDAVLTWGFTDRYTWLNNGPTHQRKQPNRPQRALPFDRDFLPKPAFFALRDGLDRHAKA